MARKPYQAKPENVRDEIADLIEHGRTNKQICDRFDDMFPDRREFGKYVTTVRRDIKKFWAKMGGGY